MIDWEPARARRYGMDWRAERFESGSWPTVRMVRGQFDSFRQAIEVAGLPARARPRRLKPHLANAESVIEAILEWTRRYGDVPAMADWDPVRARQLGQDWRIARYNQGDWPSTRTVINRFGTFRAAVEAAGLVPRARSLTFAERRLTQHRNLWRAAEAAARDRAPGLDDFASCLKILANARYHEDPVGIRAALLQVAASALAWSTVCGLDEAGQTNRTGAGEPSPNLSPAPSARA